MAEVGGGLYGLVDEGFGDADGFGQGVAEGEVGGDGGRERAAGAVGGGGLVVFAVDSDDLVA